MLVSGRVSGRQKSRLTAPGFLGVSDSCCILWDGRTIPATFGVEVAEGDRKVLRTVCAEVPMTIPFKRVLHISAISRCPLAVNLSTLCSNSTTIIPRIKVSVTQLL